MQRLIMPLKNTTLCGKLARIVNIIIIYNILHIYINGDWGLLKRATVWVLLSHHVVRCQKIIPKIWVAEGATGRHARACESRCSHSRHCPKISIHICFVITNLGIVALERWREAWRLPSKVKPGVFSVKDPQEDLLVVHCLWVCMEVVHYWELGSSYSLK